MNGIEAISKLKERFSLLNNEMPSLLQKSFSELDTFIEDANISQLEKGLRSDGVVLPNYSPVSVEVYGKPDGPIRLKDTGAFHKGIEVKAGTDSIEIIGTDYKTDMLLAMYGEEILGLTNENKRMIANDYLRVNLSENIKEHLL